MGLYKAGKKIFGKSIAKGNGHTGKLSKNKVNKSTPVEPSVWYDNKNTMSAAARKEAVDREMTLWDLDGGRKQWAAGATVGAGALGGAGYLGVGHQGKGKKKKDDTLKFLGY